MKKQEICIVASIGCCYLTIMITIIITSILSRLEPLLYGITYDAYGLQIDHSQLYTGGRHALGIGTEFIIFPRTQRLIAFSDTIKGELGGQTVDAPGFSLFSYETEKPWGTSTRGFGTIKARTKEGLVVFMDILISYKLTTTNDKGQKAKQLYQIYRNFEHNWDEMLQRLVVSEVKDVAAKHEAFEFFASRATISKSMFNHLKTTCQQYHITINSLNVLNLQFPVEFESAVEQTEIVVQQTNTTKYLMEAMQIEAETRELVASIQKDINIEKETASGEAKLEIDKATAEAIIARLETQRKALLNVKQTLKLTDKINDSAANKLLAFMWVYSLKYNNADLVRLATGLPKDLKNA